MTIKMLVFDFRESEKEFFKKHEFEHFDITFYTESLNDESVNTLSQEELDNTTVISVFITSSVTENVINKFKNLRIISTRSTGYDNISKKASMAKNIAVINVDTYGSKSVAQYTFTLILALVRKLIPAALYMKNPDGTCSNFVGRDLTKMTLGVIGTGAIGAAVCKIGHCFGMKILAYDINLKQELMDLIEIEYVSLKDLIKRADVMTVHVPYTGDNYHLISKDEFNDMKDGAYLVNTSRGEIIDTVAAYNALVTGKLSGLALDVVMCEDISFQCDKSARNSSEISLNCVKEEEVVKKLANMENAIITPHIAYATQDAIDYILEETFDGIRETIKGGNKYRVY